MAKVLLYYAHPGHRFSQSNRAMWHAARDVEGITAVDLYATYPRFDIRVAEEQALLRAHDIIVLQYPIFWYAAPSLVKEWMDLVLEHGFAYGAGGTELQGKSMMLAVTAAGPQDAYAADGYQRYPLRSFLAPMEQSARLCKMRFLAPYVLFGALQAQDQGRVAPHADAYTRLLAGLRDDRYRLDDAEERDVVTEGDLPDLLES